MVSRTRLNVTLYVHCLYCYNCFRVRGVGRGEAVISGDIIRMVGEKKIFNDTCQMLRSYQTDIR
jgi:hypothetical protein